MDHLDGSQQGLSTDESIPSITYDEKQILDNPKEAELKQELLDDSFRIASTSLDEKTEYIKQESYEYRSIKVENDQESKEESQESHENLAQYSSKLPLLALACLNQDRDAVVKLAVEEGGLVNDNIRQMACKLTIVRQKL